MTIEELFADKSFKAKARVAKIGDWLLSDKLSTEELLAFAEDQNDSNKATCIEAIEYASKEKPAVADESVFAFVSSSLKSHEPRVKWESAKVIANIAHLYSDNLDSVIKDLVKNARHTGTVVRWASASALGEILKLKTKHNKKLMPMLQTLSKAELDGGVKKKYLDAIKKAGK